MPKLTNKNEYPESVVLAITNDRYDKGDCEFSATGLITPPRIRVLREKHKDEIESDVDDQVFMLYGKMGHTLLEYANKNQLVEKRFFGLVDGVKISAQIDSLSLEPDGTLIDWKFTSVYGFKAGQLPKEEWTTQMNIQLELLRQNGHDAKRMQIWGLLRDWRPSEAARDKNYPKKLGYHEIEMFTRKQAVAMISKMIAKHREADVDIPLCTINENWSGRRCSGYCQVNKFCTQYQNALKTGVI